jgi:hypothetical protein
MPLRSDVEFATQEDMGELKEALDSANISIRAFCDFLSEEFSEPGHEDESSPEKYRGWFKKERRAPRPVLDRMWTALRSHPDFIESKQVKPVYVSTGRVDPKLERAMRQLSKRITDKLIK